MSTGPAGPPQVPGASLKRTLAGVGFQALGRLAHGLVSFALLVILAQVLDPAGVGVYAATVAFFGLLDTLVDGGSVLALVRRSSADPRQFRPLLRRAHRLRWISSGLAVAAAALYLQLDPRAPGGDLWGWLAALSLLSHVPGTDSAVFNLRLDFGYPALVRGLTAAAALAGALLMAQLGVRDPLAYLCLTQARTALANAILWLRAQPWIRAWPAEPVDTAGYLHESFTLGFGGLLREGYLRADVLFLRWTLGPEAAGLYAPARSALNFALQWPSYLLTVALPPLAADAHRSWQEFQRRCWLLARGLAVFAWPAALVSLPFAPWFLRSFFGDEYVAAAPALRILAGVAALAYPGMALVTALIACGRARAALWISALALALSLALNAGLIPAWGLPGAATARAGAELVTLLLPALILARRRP